MKEAKQYWREITDPHESDYYYELITESDDVTTLKKVTTGENTTLDTKRFRKEFTQLAWYGPDID